MFQFPGLPPPRLCVHRGGAGPAAGGFAHSETRGSPGVCPYPRIIAACRVLRRLHVPRHPPCALDIFPPTRAGRRISKTSKGCLGVALPCGASPRWRCYLMQPTPRIGKCMYRFFVRRISVSDEINRFDHGVHHVLMEQKKKNRPGRRGPPPASRLALCGSQGAPGRAPGTGYATDGTGRSPPPRAPPLLASEEKLFRLSLERR